MKVYKTAALTATWRCMGKVEKESIKKVGFSTKIIAYVLGFLDPASIQTISHRTLLIDHLIKKTNPETIVEIGAGFSTRPDRFPKIEFYQLDLPYFQSKNKNIIQFDIKNDSLKLTIKNALFIVEGVTMYLHKDEVMRLLKEIKKYKGTLLIDFFNKGQSNKNKSIREKIYKIIFKIFIWKKHLFEFRIENIDSGKKLLEKFGYRKIKLHPYELEKTLDCLFYAEF